jgi:hypothetical protein
MLRDQLLLLQKKQRARGITMTDAGITEKLEKVSIA